MGFLIPIGGVPESPGSPVSTLGPRLRRWAVPHTELQRLLSARITRIEHPGEFPGCYDWQPSRFTRSASLLCGFRPQACLLIEAHSQAISTDTAAPKARKAINRSVRSIPLFQS